MGLIRKLTFLGMCVSLSFCGRAGKKLPAQTELSELLRQKRDTYLELIKSQQDVNGFVETDACDSLLFTGLVGAVASLDIDIEAAKDSNNAWFRTPAKTCFAEGRSKSTISRDMYVGLLWYIWKHKRLDLANQIYEYGVDNLWVMGEGELSRTFFTLNMQRLLAEIIQALGGPSHNILLAYPYIYGQEVTGFEAHLQVLNALLRAEIRGNWMNQDEIDLIYAKTKEQPRNPLFQAAYSAYIEGTYEEAITTLMNGYLFPPDRLPTNQDRCTHWIPMRYDGPDWLPCSSEPFETHSGGDLIFTSYFILD